MTDLNKHFVNEELKDFEVQGLNFKYKPTTAGDENEWINEYLVTKTYTDEKGNTYQKKEEDMARLNECKLRNIKEVPYTRENIHKATGIDKEWQDMTKDERYKLFSKLQPSIFSEIIQKITTIDMGGEGDTKKE